VRARGQRVTDDSRQTQTGAATKALGKAAFFDIDGTLISTNVVSAYAYYATNAGSVTGILSRTLKTIAALPVFGGLNLIDRKIFNEFFYRSYEGLTEDRLLTLPEDMFEDLIRPAIYPKAQDLIDEARRAGCKIVLVTGALDFTMRPLARHFEGANKANVIREYCEAHGLSLIKSHAYSDSSSDYAMLTAVGRPTAVNPDPRLWALARSYNWPILNVR